MEREERVKSRESKPKYASEKVSELHVKQLILLEDKKEQVDMVVDRIIELYTEQLENADDEYRWNCEIV